jgi:predicted dienelactone hydrolase
MENPSRRSLLRVAALSCLLQMAWPVASLAQNAPLGDGYPVGIRQLDYFDPDQGGRHLAVAVFYPAVVRDPSTKPFVMPFFAHVRIYKDAEPTLERAKHPLVVFSHGRGSNGLSYAWFAEFLASRGYIVAALNHYRANTYDSTIAYLANKLWQRPFDVGLVISFLLKDPFWGAYIDDGRIGVADIRKGASPRSGSVVRRSIRRSTSPSSAAGATTRWCRSICARNCRLMPLRRST